MLLRVILQWLGRSRRVALDGLGAATGQFCSTDGAHEAKAHEVKACGAKAHEAGRTKADKAEAEGWLRRGLRLMDGGQIGEAMQALKECLARDENNAEALSNLGGLVADANPEIALVPLRRAERLAPCDLAVQVNLGATLMALGYLEEARSHFARALEIDAGYLPARNALAQADLTLGRFTPATWDAFRARWRRHNCDYRHALPDLRYLDDRELPPPAQARDRVLVHMEQGLGDEIFFAGCLEELRAHTRALAISCEPRLRELFTRAFPGIEVIARAGDWQAHARAFAPDAQVYAGDLGYWFRRSSASFPPPRAYLHADPARAAHWRARLRYLDRDGRPTLKIGISWRGGTANTGSAARSVPLWDWAGLFMLPGVRWIDLQYGEHQDELRAAQGAGVAITRFEDALADYDETAALVSQLDLVISVTTAVVDLAGALNKPCWVLVPRRSMWKFGVSGERTPWYASLRLWRQVTGEPWTAVMRRVAAGLEQLPALRAVQEEDSLAGRP